MAKPKVKMKYNLIHTADELENTDITFNNTLRVSDNEYIVVLSALDLAKLYHEDKLLYYVPTQRGVTKTTNKSGETTEEPIHSNKNIKEMIELIKESSLCNTLITLNVLDDGKDNMEYNGNILEVNKPLFILDGFHRITSMYTIFSYSLVLGGENEYTEVLKNTKFTVSIGNYTETRAKQIFSQLSKGLKLSTSKIESFDMTKASNRIVDKLNRYSVLKNMIDTTRTSINKNDEIHIYTFASFNEAIKNSFRVIQNEKEENDIYQFLSSFLKELISIFPEMMSYESRTKSKEHSLICQNMMIYGYMSIAESLYIKRSNGAWKDELKNINKIDFDINSEIWQPIMRINGDKRSLVNNRQTRDIMSKIIKEELYKAQSL